MSKQRLRKKVQELVELREMADELAAEINAIEDEIKIGRASCRERVSSPV